MKRKNTGDSKRRVKKRLLKDLRKKMEKIEKCMESFSSSISIHNGAGIS